MYSRIINNCLGLLFPSIGTVADKLSKGAGASADMVVDSSVSASSVLEATGTSSSVTKDATAVTETETLKLKSPLEPVDFSFFAETTNNQPAAGGQPTGTLQSALDISNTDISNYRRTSPARTPLEP